MQGKGLPVTGCQGTNLFRHNRPARLEGIDRIQAQDLSRLFDSRHRCSVQQNKTGETGRDTRVNDAMKW